MEGLDEVALGLEMGQALNAIAEESSGVCTCGIKFQTGIRVTYLLLLLADVVTDSVEAGMISYTQLHHGNELIDRLLYTWIALVLCSWLLFIWELGINIQLFKVCKGDEGTNTCADCFISNFSKILITHDFFVMLIEDILTTSVSITLFFEDAISRDDWKALANQISAGTTLVACCFQMTLYCRRAAKFVFLSEKSSEQICECCTLIWIHVLFTFMAAATIAVSSFKLGTVLELDLVYFIGSPGIVGVCLLFWILLLCVRWCFDCWRPIFSSCCDCCNNKVVPWRPI